METLPAHIRQKTRAGMRCNLSLAAAPDPFDRPGDDAAREQRGSEIRSQGENLYPWLVLLLGPALSPRDD
ncbi:MAG: hypothetical protein AAF317_20330, partial [Pseudomonadota bacterium]